MGARLARCSTTAEEMAETDQPQNLDWDDEASLYHKSAINCLHNYALGKMELVDYRHSQMKSKTSIKRRFLKGLRGHISGNQSSLQMERSTSGRKRSSISFARDLEQIYEIEADDIDGAEPNDCVGEYHDDNPQKYCKDMIWGSPINHQLSCASKAIYCSLSSPTCVTSLTFLGDSAEVILEPLQFPEIE